MKIYVASSWRNIYYPSVVSALREAGHDVYDFRNPPVHPDAVEGEQGFKWEYVDPNYMGWTPEEYKERLHHPKAERQFKNDIEAMESCDACVDAFHMTGAEAFPVSLQLDLLAKNLLVEEFPASKNYLKPHKGDDNIWYFDTKVFNIYGIGRFYIGLANHIKILNCPQLKDFAKEFASKHLL